MLTAKLCTYENLKEGIEVAAEGDNDLWKYYEGFRTIHIESIRDMVQDNYNKVIEHEDVGIMITNYLVYSGDVLIGFFSYRMDEVNKRNCLVSFGINKKYRVKRGVLIDFFNVIISKLGNQFFCVLWGVNTRAVIWLMKMGMQFVRYAELKNEKLVILKFE